MSSSQKIVLAIGGTGAQGVPVVKALTSDSKYAVRVLTRTAASAPARELSALAGVTIVEGNVYKEATLRKAFTGVDYAFVNTNGFAIGEAKEIYWGIRMYEIAAECGVKHYLWGSLDYASKLGNFDPKYRVGHLDGKAKVAEFLSTQPTSRMAWSVLTSCMYIEMLSERLAPRPDPADPSAVVFYAPLGSGKAPMIHLPDLGRYARWIFDTPARSIGMNLRIATESIGWKYLAETFTEVTGRKASYQDVTLDEYFAMGAMSNPEAKVGHAMGHDDDTLVTIRENFSGFWNTWKDDLVQRDYALLDAILPDRVKSIGEWMRLTGYNGEQLPVLKDYVDQAR